jgi:hypothetical protein
MIRRLTSHLAITRSPGMVKTIRIRLPAASGRAVSTETVSLGSAGVQRESRQHNAAPRGLAFGGGCAQADHEAACQPGRLLGAAFAFEFAARVLA